MKKIFNILLIAAAALGFATSCSDVPMPYDINNNGGEASFGKKLPYKSASLSSFSMFNAKEGAAWSQGSSYTQATGYQAWDGGSKFNKEVESYLISPALCTKCESGKVRISFDHTLRYTNNVSGWQKNHKIYMSKDFDGIASNYEKAHWTQLNYTPAASTYSDWTLYSSGYINVPEEFVNRDSVYVSFYFYAPASASTTWELENFLIEEGEASETPGGNDNPDTPAEGAGTKESPLNVASAKNSAGKKGYVTGYIVGYIDGTKFEEGSKFEAAAADETELLLADAADCKDATICLPVQLPAGELRTALNPSKAENIGKKVTLYGSFETYFGTTGMKATSWASMDGKEYGKDPEAPETPETPAAEAKGDGTQASPYNVSGVIKYVNTLGADKNSANEVYIEGIVCDEPNIDTNYGNATFHISDDGTANNSFYIFRTFDFGGAKFTDNSKVKKGDKVVIVGNVVNYKGNTPETVASKSHIYSINGQTSGNSSAGGDTPDTPSGTSEGLSINKTTVTLTNSAVTAGSETATLVVNEIEDINSKDKKEATGTYDFPDGATLTVAKGNGTTAPTYYSASNGFRIYASNTLTFAASKDIATITMECDSYNGTDYVGNKTATISFEGKKVTYCNYFDDSNKGGTQLRVKKITITYAK